MSNLPNRNIRNEVGQHIHSQDSRKSHIPTRLSLLAADRSFQEHEVELGTDYQLLPQDVVCGSARDTANHPGNGRYKVLIEMRMQRYLEASSRVAKTKIVKEIVDAVRESGGCFVRRTAGVWFDIGNQRAKTKTGAAIRGCVKSAAHRPARRKPRKLSSTNDLSHASPSANGSGDQGFAFSSRNSSTGGLDHDLGRLYPEPIGVSPSRIMKPDGFDEFVRTTFLGDSNEMEPLRNVSNPSSNGDDDEVDCKERSSNVKSDPPYY